MRLLAKLYEELTRAEALEFQQELIERLPDCYDFELETLSNGYGVRVTRGDKLIALISFDGLRPFNATFELISRVPRSLINGFSAWIDHDKFFAHVEKVLKA